METQALQTENRTTSARIAETVIDVERAWQLVHDVYVQHGYIEANRYGLHTVPWAIGPQSLVTIVGSARAPSVTMTAILDTELGLPSDCLFGEQISHWRTRGRLLEIGLFAAAGALCGPTALIELMRHALAFGLQNGCTDLICSVHPSHASLYRRVFGFQIASEPRPYSLVRGNPAVLLRASHDVIGSRAPAAIRRMLAEPVSAECLNARYRFDLHSMQNSALASYLREESRKSRPRL